MSFVAIYAMGALAILGLMVTPWIMSLVLKNSSIVDIFWGPGFVLTNAVYAVMTPDDAPARKMLVAVLVTFWGLRLGAYTRHPNYFGDAAQWWGFYLIAVVAGGSWTIRSPILMTVLLLPVPGVALLEKTLTETKPACRNYVESTSAFVPWFPRRAGRDKGYVTR